MRSTVTYDAACAGLYRLQNIHAAAAALAEDSRHSLSTPSFVAVRTTGIDDLHALLRRIDASDVASRFGEYRFGDRRKCIVLDFSTKDALTTILRQVNQSVEPLVDIPVYLLEGDEERQLAKMLNVCYSTKRYATDHGRSRKIQLRYPIAPLFRRFASTVKYSNPNSNIVI